MDINGQQDKAPNLEQLPRDELLTLAQELGLQPEISAEACELATEIRHRRDLLETLDHKAMLEVAAWGRRPVRTSASKEELAREINRIEKMSLQGLSRRGLYALGVLRGVDVKPDDTESQLILALKAHESLFKKFQRKRRRLVGKLVAKMLGDGAQEQYKFLPDERRPPSLKERIEERGLVGGLADRLRGAADDYIAAKLDEIEHRIDRKLNEIDQRLAQWRDKEVANRLRIIKITLYASVIVALISVLYAWMVKHFFQ